jgi:hypothetical protein
MITSADEFKVLFESESEQDHARLRFDEATDEVWFTILQRYPDAINTVILNKTVPLSILRYLSNSTDPRIRWEVAMKRKLDIDLFGKLSRDPDETVRVRIAYNKKTPKSILERLAIDESDQVAVIAKERLKGNS